MAIWYEDVLTILSMGAEGVYISALLWIFLGTASKYIAPATSGPKLNMSQAPSMSSYMFTFTRNKEIL